MSFLYPNVLWFLLLVPVLIVLVVLALLVLGPLSALIQMFTNLIVRGLFTLVGMKGFLI